MRRVRLLAAVALAAAVLPVTPGTAAPPVERLGLVLRRTTNGPSSWTLNVSIANDHTNGSFVGGAGARFVRGKPVNAIALAAASSRRWEDSTLQVGDVRVSSCTVGVCGDDRVLGAKALGSTYSDDGLNEDAATHFFVVAYGRDVSYTFRGRGWQVVTDRAPLAYRYVDGGEHSVASSHVGLYGVEVSGEYAARGGRHGSLALAFPPCSVAASGIVSRGVGAVTLDGGAEPKTFVCPADRAYLSDYAPRATTWRLHGPAAGETTLQETRLFVLDVPARLP